MISPLSRLDEGAHPTVRHMAGWKQILFTAFLSFALVSPSAFAACGGKNLARGTALLPADARAESLPSAPLLPIPALGSSAIVGLWNVTFTSGGEVVDVAFDAWHSDQTEILNDYTPPAEGNVCLGAWEQVGFNTYKLKHPSWSFDANGNLLGTVVIGEVVKVSADGNSFSGTYTYDIYDVSGDFLEEFTGTIKAARIRPS
jgi:hypothetical protein